MEKERDEPDHGHMHCTKQTWVGQERPGGPWALVLPCVSHPSWGTARSSPMANASSQSSLCHGSTSTTGSQATVFKTIHPVP